MEEETNVENIDPSLELFAAIESRAPVAVVREIVARRPDLLKAKGANDFLPIHWAVIATDHPSQVALVKCLANRLPSSLGKPTASPRDFALNREDGRMLPIHLAAMHDGPHQFEVVQYLAKKYPRSLRIKTARHYFPVHQALKFDASRDVARLLVELLPDEFSENERLGLLHFTIDSVGSSHLRQVQLPHEFLEKVDLLMTAFPGSLRAKLRCFERSSVAHESRTSLPLHLAVWRTIHNNYPVDLVRMLVERAPETRLEPDSEGNLPLHIALFPFSGWCRHLEALLAILLRDCPESTMVVGRFEHIPLDRAIRLGDYRCAELLVDLAPRCCRCVDAEGRTPLHVAAPILSVREDAAGIVTRLIQSWPESLLHQDAEGKLPLHEAISRFTKSSTLRAMEMLLDQCPESVRVPLAGGRRPLHLAVTQKVFSPPLVRLLLDRRPESLKEPDAEGNLPLFLAVQKRDALVFIDSNDADSNRAARADWIPMVRCLVDPWPESLRIRDAGGNLLLFCAAENPNTPLDLIYYLARAIPDLIRNRR